NVSIDIDGIMVMGVMWMPFSCFFLRSWAAVNDSNVGTAEAMAVIGEDGATMYTAVVEEGSSGMERETAAIVFNLLLAAIKIVGSKRLLWVAM
ncbi:hypothetical protein BHM03_00061690, partial [Ensete ventricosum]